MKEKCFREQLLILQKNKTIAVIIIGSYLSESK
jgi:hypothetical protein